MAQNKQLTWTELRVGLFVLAGTVLLVVVIFYVTGAGTGAEVPLHAFLPEVDGLTVGAPVRVDGVDVGNVEKIIDRPAKTRSRRIRNTGVSKSIMRIQKTFQDYIRTDSTAGLDHGGIARRSATWISIEGLSAAYCRMTKKSRAARKKP